VDEIIFVVKESEDGGYEATAVSHLIFTQGDDWEDLKAMVTDAVRLYFSEGEAPKSIRLVFTREEVLAA